MVSSVRGFWRLSLSDIDSGPQKNSFHLSGVATHTCFHFCCIFFCFVGEGWPLSSFQNGQKSRFHKVIVSSEGEFWEVRVVLMGSRAQYLGTYLSGAPELHSLGRKLGREIETRCLWPFFTVFYSAFSWRKRPKKWFFSKCSKWPRMAPNTCIWCILDRKTLREGI